LRARGWEVEVAVAYRTVGRTIDEPDRVRVRGADVVTFTASSTVNEFVDVVGIEHTPPMVACIGPVTAATARDRGLSVDVVADVHTVAGLVEALVQWFDTRPIKP
jgi:uroporphyrinogen III methyltransferase/synthase